MIFEIIFLFAVSKLVSRRHFGFETWCSTPLVAIYSFWQRNSAFVFWNVWKPLSRECYGGALANGLTGQTGVACPWCSKGKGAPWEGAVGGMAGCGSKSKTTGFLHLFHPNTSCFLHFFTPNTSFCEFFSYPFLLPWPGNDVLFHESFSPGQGESCSESKGESGGKGESWTSAWCDKGCHESRSEG